MLIIGIIISIIMGSKEILNSSQSKQFHQTFVSKWLTIINTYKSKTNQSFTDSTQNGGTNTYNNGYFDGIDMSLTTNQNNIKNTLLNVGINPCALLSTTCTMADNSCDPSCYNISGEFHADVNIRVYFNPYIFDNKPSNYLVLNNIPADVASAIDKLIDSQADGTSGNALAISTLGNYSNDENISTLSPISFDSSSEQIINLAIKVE